jgi:hypothetical protein
MNFALQIGRDANFILHTRTLRRIKFVIDSEANRKFQPCSIHQLKSDQFLKEIAKVGVNKFFIFFKVARSESIPKKLKPLSPWSALLRIVIR